MRSQKTTSWWTRRDASHTHAWGYDEPIFAIFVRFKVILHVLYSFYCFTPMNVSMESTTTGPLLKKISGVVYGNIIAYIQILNLYSLIRFWSLHCKSVIIHTVCRNSISSRQIHIVDKVAYAPSDQKGFFGFIIWIRYQKSFILLILRIILHLSI